MTEAPFRRQGHEQQRYDASPCHLYGPKSGRPDRREGLAVSAMDNPDGCLGRPQVAHSL